MKKLAAWIIAFDVLMIVLTKMGYIDEGSGNGFFYVWCGLLLVAIAHVVAAELRASEVDEAVDEGTVLRNPIR